MQNRRTERGQFLPPFWKLDNHYVLVDFRREFNLPFPEDIRLYVEGQYNCRLDGKRVPGRPIHIPAGHHSLELKVFNQDSPPVIYVRGTTITSDTSWRVTFEDKEWIDASGKASDKSGTAWMPAEDLRLSDPSIPPSRWRLTTQPQPPVRIERYPGGMLADFGKETFGYVRLHGLHGKGKLTVYYGESREEALSTDSCETLDRIEISGSDTTLQGSRAFRYVNIRGDVQPDSVSMLYEYLPVADRGSFRCSDEELNKIWQVAAYTFHLNTREFFIDGIKRDRWIWSGDACQSYLMSYYLFFDSSEVTRTLWALRGKDPVTSHINTIMDYSFYWFLGIYDYYLYTGDSGFIRRIYPRMVSLMDFILSRRDKQGWLQGLPGDWLFIDWADGLTKKGELSFEQLLFIRSLRTMGLCAGLTNDTAAATRYNSLSTTLRGRFFNDFWDARRQALVHSRGDGDNKEKVNRYSNMFAILFDWLTPQQKDAVKNGVLLNDSVQKITTPYMRFYELEALCALGQQERVLKEMKDYWGGMLKLGATSFWEKYDPSEKGVQHYAMYGRPFGKSLCHAWGASPLYLLGKYYLGVRPTAPGYAKYIVEPVLGGMEWMEGAVPTPHGDIKVSCSRSRMEVNTMAGSGVLRFRSRTMPVCKQGKVRRLQDDQYEILLDPAKKYTVAYRE
jgi:hypothetical protein